MSNKCLHQANTKLQQPLALYLFPLHKAHSSPRLLLSRKRKRKRKKRRSIGPKEKQKIQARKATMLEESLPSIWASMNSWFTPTVLFVLVNLMIGTIAITSSIGSQKHKEQQPKLHPQIIQRAPSILERLKSIDLYRYRSEISDPPPATAVDTVSPPPDPVEPEQEEEGEEEEELEINPIDHQNPVVVSAHDHDHDYHVMRSKSDRKPRAGEMPVKLAKKMRKSASAKSAFRHFAEEEDAETPVVVRPSTVKEGKKNASDLMAFGDDEEVDSRADDFINKFKQQLKLQRLDSLMRYKEIISRGASK